MGENNFDKPDQEKLVKMVLQAFCDYVNQPIFINPGGSYSSEEIESMTKKVDDFFSEYGDIKILSDVRPQEDIYLLFGAYDGDDGGPITVFAVFDNFENEATLEYITYDFDGWIECYNIDYRTGKGQVKEAK